MRNLILFLATFWSMAVWAQPCVQIESILVDACTLTAGNCPDASSSTCDCEGMNEMMRFRIGNNDLSVANLTINWASNQFLGICQNATTAQNVAELNQGIEACGLLVEPVNGVLPAGSQVLVVTSTNMCLEANSFANLSDTLIILFQCPGNYIGHFANYGTGLRTATVSFGAGCFSSVTYDRSLLITQDGQSAPEDGAGVLFNANGQASSYYNNGCNAPVPQQVLEAGPNTSVCAGTPIALQGIAEGAFTNIQWSGGAGTFANSGQAQTTYTPAPSENGVVVLTLSAENCLGDQVDQVSLTILPLPVADIGPAILPPLCAGNTLTLSLPANTTGMWSTGENANSIVVSEPGIYSVAVQNMCGVAEDEVEVVGGEAPDVELLPAQEQVICDGQPVTFSASGNGTLSWPDGSSGASFTTTTAGSFNLTLTNICGSATLPFTVIDGGTAPTAQIANLGASELCLGETTQLTGSGNGDLSWSTGATGATATVNAGTHTLTVTNACGTAESSITIAAIPGDPAEIIVGEVAALCAGGALQLEATGDGTLTWNDGTVGNFLTVDSLGSYFVTAVNDCGTTTAEVVVIPSSIMADFVPSTFFGGLPLGVQFTNTSAGGANYQWFLNETPVALTVNWWREFTYPGLYEVTLIAEDAFGCVDTTWRVIEVILEDDQLFVPNAFTPDGDNLNEVFRAYGPAFEDFNFEIYNRWGQRIFATNDIEDGWNGSVVGGDYYSQTEVYVWVITYTHGAERLRKTGHVTVLR